MVVYYYSPPKRIDQIHFGLLSPQEIRKMSVVRIITADTYDEDGFPIEMGLMDPRLGVIDPGLKCKTCGSRAGDCQGHFGHIELVAPVVHVGYAKLIRKLLRAVCRNCSRLMLTEGQRDEYLKKIEELRAIKQPIDDVVREVLTEARKGRTCPYCGAEQMDIKYEKPTTFYENGERLMPTEIRSRLEKMTDEDIIAVGMDPKNARPEWCVLTVLPVPPVTVRPSITLESGQRSEDDLTHKLVDIIRISQRFQENKEAGAPQLIIEDLWELLQYHVTTYLDNEVAGVPPARHRSGRPLKTLSQRLKGKEGRFRGSLSGKRVNFSARTVISPDPNLSINEVGVPIQIATELTVPLHVTPFNLEEAKEYVRRVNVHPGANYAIRPDGRRVKVLESNAEEIVEMLEPGWIVERHLKDGDIVLFNRQPSLHRLSIMAHRVKVLPGKTFRLNPAVCPPYNADFDGDEMNMHVIQTFEAQAEALILMKVQENILSPRFGGPIIGGIHDHVTGLFMLTRGNQRLDKRSFIELIKKCDFDNHLPEPAGYVNDTPYWTGRQAFSMILPKDFSIEYSNGLCDRCKTCKREKCDRDAFVSIVNGELRSGAIDKKGIGAFDGIILDRIVKEYSSSDSARFIDNFTKLSIQSMMHFGFSFGIKDEDIDQVASSQIEEVLDSAERRVAKLIEAYETGELEASPGRTIDETLELRIMEELGKARDSTGEIAGRQMGQDNPAVVMASSGARGSMLNITQIAASVGQQSVRGERIRRGYRGRTLSHFAPGDLGAEAHGFVKRGYKNGLTPVEYFFHAIGGREGLVDTAVRTSQSGYLQRRLINALQDLEVGYDGSVRETRGVIVQFSYGEDSVDPAKSDHVRREAVRDIVASVTGKELR
ncbi:MAG: DNA-directed RNA polymerase subunit A' [Methermicoccaceae archaeon]